MNVLSLFDGMGSGLLALKNCGVKVDNYFASEIEEESISIALKNHPEIIQLGDVTKVNKKHLPKIDLLIGGSPCQGFSGVSNLKSDLRLLNFDHPESKLFFEYVRLLNELKPTYHFLENVRMKKEWQDVITEYVGCKPVYIDSVYFNGVNRRRLYWTTIPNYDILDKTEKKNIYNFIEDKEVNPENSFIEGKRKHFYQFLKDRGIKNIRYTDKDYDIHDPRLVKDFYPNIIPLKSNAGCIITSCGIPGWCGYGFYVNGIMRVPTIREVELFQGLPIDYTEGVSISHRRAMIGNGWHIPTIEWFFNSLKRK